MAELTVLLGFKLFSSFSSVFSLRQSTCVGFGPYCCAIEPGDAALVERRSNRVAHRVRPSVVVRAIV